MISVNHLFYRAGSQVILDDLSFQAAAGELLVILGANGAGKSTLMKLLCRELQPAAGEIIFRGQALQRYTLAELARERAVLAQQNLVSISFIVQELVMMGRYPHFEQRPGDTDRLIVEQVMEETGVSHLADRDYHTLSGGEQQRVQLARVLAQVYDRAGACLFFDEPINGLDLRHQQQFMELIRKLADRGYGVICVLHDINFAARFADLLLLLKNGRKVAFGTPENVVNCENIHETFNISVNLLACEGYRCPLVVPASVQN